MVLRPRAPRGGRRTPSLHERACCPLCMAAGPHHRQEGLQDPGHHRSQQLPARAQDEAPHPGPHRPLPVHPGGPSAPRRTPSTGQAHQPCHRAQSGGRPSGPLLAGSWHSGNRSTRPCPASRSLPTIGRPAQVKASPVKVFVLHLEVVTEDQNVHRVSISSMYHEDTFRVRAAKALAPGGQVWGSESSGSSEEVGSGLGSMNNEGTSRARRHGNFA